MSKKAEIVKLKDKLATIVMLAAAHKPGGGKGMH